MRHWAWASGLLTWRLPSATRGGTASRVFCSEKAPLSAADEGETSVACNTPCDGGCNPICDEGCSTTWRGLQPYAPDAATLRERRLQVAVDLHAVLGGGEAGERKQALVERLQGT